jgi:hypothetical protein
MGGGGDRRAIGTQLEAAGGARDGHGHAACASMRAPVRRGAAEPHEGGGGHACRRPAARLAVNSVTWPGSVGSIGRRLATTLPTTSRDKDAGTRTTVSAPQAGDAHADPRLSRALDRAPRNIRVVAARSCRAAHPCSGASAASGSTRPRTSGCHDAAGPGASRSSRGRRPRPGAARAHVERIDTSADSAAAGLGVDGAAERRTPQPGRQRRRARRAGTRAPGARSKRWAEARVDRGMRVYV